jgi:hypothetical protein
MAQECASNCGLFKFECRECPASRRRDARPARVLIRSGTPCGTCRVTSKSLTGSAGTGLVSRAPGVARGRRGRLACGRPRPQGRIILARQRRFLVQQAALSCRVHAGRARIAVTRVTAPRAAGGLRQGWCARTMNNPWTPPGRHTHDTAKTPPIDMPVTGQAKGSFQICAVAPDGAVVQDRAGSRTGPPPEGLRPGRSRTATGGPRQTLTDHRRAWSDCNRIAINRQDAGGGQLRSNMSRDPCPVFRIVARNDTRRRICRAAGRSPRVATPPE